MRHLNIWKARWAENFVILFIPGLFHIFRQQVVDFCWHLLAVSMRVFFEGGLYHNFIFSQYIFCYDLEPAGTYYLAEVWMKDSLETVMRSVPLFKGLGPSACSALSGIVRRKSFLKGQAIFEE